MYDLVPLTLLNERTLSNGKMCFLRDGVLDYETFNVSAESGMSYNLQMLFDLVMELQ